MQVAVCCRAKVAHSLCKTAHNAKLVSELSCVYALSCDNAGRSAFLLVAAEVLMAVVRTHSYSQCMANKGRL